MWGGIGASVLALAVPSLNRFWFVSPCVVRVNARAREPVRALASACPRACMCVRSRMGACACVRARVCERVRRRA
jgi:hypothetical protein